MPTIYGGFLVGGFRLIPNKPSGTMAYLDDLVRPTGFEPVTH